MDGAGVEKIGSLLKLEWEKEGGGRLLILTLYQVENLISISHWGRNWGVGSILSPEF